MATLLVDKVSSVAIHSFPVANNTSIALLCFSSLFFVTIKSRQICYRILTTTTIVGKFSILEIAIPFTCVLFTCIDHAHAHTRTHSHNHNKLKQKHCTGHNFQFFILHVLYTWLVLLSVPRSTNYVGHKICTENEQSNTLNILSPVAFT